MKTTQRTFDNKVGKKFLQATRTVSGAPAEVVPSDVAIDWVASSRDLVASLLKATSQGTQNQKQVDLVTPNGQRVKVLARRIPVSPTPNGNYPVSFGVHQTIINFLPAEQRPDLVFAVVYNPHTNRVDVFRFYPKDDESREFALGSLAYSRRTGGYNSKEKFLYASIPAS